MFGTVTRDLRLSDKVEDSMVQTILSRGLKPGDRLPSERELGDQFGVSRTVIREAVRSLAAKGLIEVRTGSGLRVARLDPSTVSQSMNFLLRGNGGLDYEKVHEVRSMLEEHVAGLAAERARDEDIERLRAICDHMAAVLDDPEAASRADVEFHRAIAQMTYNELYTILIDTIGDVMLEVRRQTMNMPGRASNALRAHRRILSKIAARDPAGARKAMKAHLDEARKFWQRMAPEVATQSLPLPPGS